MVNTQLHVALCRSCREGLREIPAVRKPVGHRILVASWRTRAITSSRRMRAARQILSILRAWRRGRGELCPVNSLQEIDDQGWVEFSSREKLAPTLAKAIEELALEKYLPADLVVWLQLARRRNMERNECILDEIEKFTRHLNEIGVSPCFLKGAAYILDDVYGDIGDRFFVDVDCLLPEGQLSEAFERLLKVGYTPWEIEGISDSSAHLHPLFSPTYEVSFELHRHISYLSPLDTKVLPARSVLNRSEERRRGEIVFRLPNMTHRLSHVLSHATLSPEQLLRGGLYLRDLIDLDILCQRASPREQKKSVSCFHYSTLLRTRAESALSAASILLGTPIEKFGPISAVGKVGGNLAVSRLDGPAQAIICRLVGMTSYLCLSILHRPDSFSTTLVNIYRQVRRDLGFGRTQEERDG